MGWLKKLFGKKDEGQDQPGAQAPTDMPQEPAAEEPKEEIPQ